MYIYIIMYICIHNVAFTIIGNCPIDLCMLKFSLSFYKRQMVHTKNILSGDNYQIINCNIYIYIYMA